MRLVWGTVGEIVGEREGFQRLRVTTDDGLQGTAICYPDLAGSCSAGDRVLLNVTAVELGLGTGGMFYVAARCAPGEEPSGTALASDSGGHIIKLRYTPMQRDVLCAEAQESAYHDMLADADSAEGMPVVCCGLHSQLPLAAAAVKELVPDARIAYIMTDAAALPMAVSDLVPACISAGLVDVTITCGQALGGEIEAVTLHSAILAARHAALADVAIVAIGPGIAGTATPFGHGGVSQGEAVNAASAVGAEPVAALRLSFADERERHRGVSHHSLVALSRVALAPARVAVPELAGEQSAEVERALEDAGVWERHVRVPVPARPLPDTRGVTLRSMGRGPAEDPAFFSAAAAAGTVAAELLRETQG